VDSAFLTMEVDDEVGGVVANALLTSLDRDQRLSLRDLAWSAPDLVVRSVPSISLLCALQVVSGRTLSAAQGWAASTTQRGASFLHFNFLDSCHALRKRFRMELRRCRGGRDCGRRRAASEVAEKVWVDALHVLDKLLDAA
jgi:hypothetical protein